MRDAEKTRDAYLQKTYNITLSEYNAILESQGGGCAICGATAKTRSLHVDHDHKSMKVRGILCFMCNKKLLPGGRDNPAIFFRAMKYLQLNPAKEIIGIRLAPKIVRRRKKRKPRKPV